MARVRVLTVALALELDTPFQPQTVLYARSRRYSYNLDKY
jgi:hypothetical protein